MKWKAIKAFISKELKLTLRSKESIFWIIAWPLIWLLFSAYVFIPPGVNKPMTLDVGVINYDTNSTHPVNGTLFVTILKEIEYKGSKLFNVKEYSNETAMIEDIRSGKLDGGFVIPENFGKDLVFGQAKITIYVGARDIQSSQINEAILRGFIEGMNRETSLRKINESLKYMELYALQYLPENLTIPILENKSWIEFMRIWMLGLALPINASFIDVKPKIFTTRETILGWTTLGAFGMTLLYSGLMAGSLMAVEEKEKGTLKRLLASPATSTDMLIGKTIANLIILGLTAVIIILVGLGCGAKILWNPTSLEHWLIPFLLILASIFVIGLGMLLSLVVRTIKGASGISVSLGLMLAFLAGIWFPKWMLPPWLRVLGDLFPATWAIDAMRSIMVYELPLTEVLPDVIKVLVATIVTYALGVLAYKRVLRKYVEL